MYLSKIPIILTWTECCVWLITGSVVSSAETCLFCYLTCQSKYLMHKTSSGQRYLTIFKRYLALLSLCHPGARLVQPVSLTISRSLNRLVIKVGNSWKQCSCFLTRKFWNYAAIWFRAQFKNQDSIIRSKLTSTLLLKIWFTNI